MTAELINGTKIAEEVRAEVAEGVREMRDRHGIAPGLAVILVGDDPASSVYVRSKERAALEAGMVSNTVLLPADASEKEVLAQLARLNGDARIHGILVQLPVPDHIDENIVIEAINPAKDVDGLHPFNMGLLMAGRPRFVPATRSSSTRVGPSRRSSFARMCCSWVFRCRTCVWRTSKVPERAS